MSTPDPARPEGGERLSRRAMECLAAMRDANESLEGELVRDGGRVFWLGDDTYAVRTVYSLLRVCALCDVSDVKGAERYVINDTGLALLRRPELAGEIKAALHSGRAFQIVNDRITDLPADPRPASDEGAG